MKKQAGFTLIELVMVIVILGILAAVALPKFTNLSGEAKLASIRGVAGALASGSAINTAVHSLNAASGIATSAVACSTVAAGVIDGGAPAGFTFGGTAPACTVDTNPATSAVSVTISVI